MITLGAHFEAEIGEQPTVWRALAASDKAQVLADAVRGRDVVFLGSGSSLFVAQLGALAFRRRGIRAVALASSEARFDRNAYRGGCVVALSQSGRSADVLDALAFLEPTSLVAVTNDATSPLAERADVAIAIDAGRERAIPATKSVTTMNALLLWAASLLSGEPTRDAAALARTADAVAAFLAGIAADEAFSAAAATIAGASSVVFVGAGYGVPIASELALKLKEATYLHGEGFAAGEFRHGSTALLDERCAIVGIFDESESAVAARPIVQAAGSGALRYTIGADLAGVVRLGAIYAQPFATLGALVTGQRLALAVGRARGIDGDSPRGLVKILR